MEISKQDWALFREKLPGWQEKHMGNLLTEYMELLNSDQRASERFWALEKRIRTDKCHSGVIADVKRSNMRFILLDLLKAKTIDEADIADFSDEIKDSLALCLRIF